jgi:branched-chain amino acid transport system ATP-binding protein
VPGGPQRGWKDDDDREHHGPPRRRSGRISLRGGTSGGCPPTRARLGIGYAPEDCGIFPDLTVEENFQITAWLTRGRREGAAGRPARGAPATTDEPAFGVFPEVRDLLKRRGLHLSGGQKKMVAITRAMTLSPAILLLDEPFEGLAPVVVTRFIEAVRAIKAMGISVLIAESNVANAARVADRLYAIDRGEIVFEGRPGDALQDPDVLKILRG